MKNDDSISLSLSKKKIKIILFILCVFIGLCFIPSEKEVSLPDYEHSTKYSNGVSYKYKVYKTNTGCLDDAWWSASGNRAEYDIEAAKCKSLETDKVATVLQFNNGACNTRLDYTTNTIVDDCDTFYIKDNSLYEDLRLDFISKGHYSEKYNNKVDIKITSGSGISVENYFTASCRAFGLICSSGEFLDKDTNIHTRLIIGSNVKISKYSKTCDGYSGIALKDVDTCIYVDDKPINATIKEILSQ